MPKKKAATTTLSDRLTRIERRLESLENAVNRVDQQLIRIATTYVREDTTPRTFIGPQFNKKVQLVLRVTKLGLACLGLDVVDLGFLVDGASYRIPL